MLQIYSSILELQSYFLDRNQWNNHGAYYQTIVNFPQSEMFFVLFARSLGNYL